MGSPAGRRCHRFFASVNCSSCPSEAAGMDPELDEAEVIWSVSPAASSAFSGDGYGSFSPVSSDFGDGRRSSRRTVGLSALPADQVGKPASTTVVLPVPTSAPAVHQGGIFRQSAPMAVPVWPKRSFSAKSLLMSRDGDEEYYDMKEDEEEEREMLPPHLMLAARSTRTSSMAAGFSVLEGAGRTLKGRDLRRVRNGVLRRTGFLDL